MEGDPLKSFRGLYFRSAIYWNIYWNFHEYPMSTAFWRCFEHGRFDACLMNSCLPFRQDRIELKFWCRCQTLRCGSRTCVQTSFFVENGLVAVSTHVLNIHIHILTWEVDIPHGKQIFRLLNEGFFAAGHILAMPKLDPTF